MSSFKVKLREIINLQKFNPSLNGSGVFTSVDSGVVGNGFVVSAVGGVVPVEPLGPGEATFIFGSKKSIPNSRFSRIQPEERILSL